ncbi:hypothetical protein [Streptomyces naphthomycinicus]|uniref:hypothetical protein n=1 Tax=Streptomyces naphthomycinicus TaxID=2872625 RepID=UPI001CEC355E|nr:hypothetical protein [Streptomyces sp. TML10]
MTTAKSPNFVTDTVNIQFERCGHAFTADGEAIDAAGEQARLLADQEEQRPVDEQAAPTPLEDARATVESLRYQIRRAREALGTAEPVLQLTYTEDAVGRDSNGVLVVPLTGPNGAAAYLNLSPMVARLLIDRVDAVLNRQEQP